MDMLLIKELKDMLQGSIGIKLILAAVLLFGGNVFFSQNNLAVYFTQEQPANTISETSFSEDIRGTYNKDEAQFVDVVIDEHTVEVRYLTRMFLPTATIESEAKYYIENNLLFGVDSAGGLEYFTQNDTVYFGVFQKEVLFNTKTDVVKKLNNQYVISKPIAENAWEVNLLYKKGNTLYIRTIDIVKDKQKLEQTIKTLPTSTVNNQKAYLLTPNQNQFKRFVSAKGFYDIITYTKAN